MYMLTPRFLRVLSVATSVSESLSVLPEQERSTTGMSWIHTEAQTEAYAGIPIAIETHARMVSPLP